MSESKPIIGPEGLSSPPAIAQQVSAIEKKADEAVSSIRREEELRWHGHLKQHSQEQEAVEKAVVAMDKRLDGLNELRQAMNDRDKSFTPISAHDELARRIDRAELDSRQRFENLDKRINDLSTMASREAREQGRPGQDLKSNQSAIVAVVLFAVTVIGFLVVVVNFLSRGP